MGEDGTATASPEATLRTLYGRYAGPLLGYAQRATGSREVAEDIVQETLLRAWRHADRYEAERGSMDTWLFTIARNLVIDHHRRRAARPRSVAQVEDHEPVETDEALERAVEAWQVATALRRLSEDHRAAIVETYYRGASVAQAAERLGVPEGTVKSRLHYGLRNLRLVLEEIGVIG